MCDIIIAITVTDFNAKLMETVNFNFLVNNMKPL